MEEPKSILHELYVYSEWKPEPEYIQKPDSLLPENISALWRWMKFLGPKKSLIDSVTAHKERQQKWHIALGDEGKVIAILTDNILEIRTKRTEYATIAARTTVSRDAYAQWRKLVWSPDCAFVVIAYGNGVVSFFDLTASNLFNIPIDCSRPGGLECTDNTHAVADIIFMPLRVKDTKWSWEVLIVNYDGKVRGYLVSVMDGFTLHHTSTFSGGVACVAYCDLHSTLYVAGVPRGSHKDENSAHCAGITAWRILNDEPYYKLSVVSDQLEAQANDKFHLYIPFVTAKNLAFIVQMSLSPDGSKLVCLHCNGDVSLWRLPLLKLLRRFPLVSQPGYDLTNPLLAEENVPKNDVTQFYPADVNWWSNEEVIVSRFSGAVCVCDARSLASLLARAEYLRGAPRVTRAHAAAFLALECEAGVLPARGGDAVDSMELLKAEEDLDDNVFELAKELFKSILFAITDMETFQPKPRRITCVSRVYRLLAVKSTTPTELFSRKIESGHYSEALALADTFHLDSDLVYQQQWRKNPVSTDAIQKYLSKVSKKIWAVHQCVDRLPETLPAAKELLQFGLELTNEEILDEINKDRPEEEQITDPADIVPEHLNAYTSELLRCRHVMLFYKERLWLYECILKFEKSTYQKDEYDRLRSNSVMRSSMEIAKEGRIEALTCLWPHIKTTAMKLAVLEKLPETINPIDYQHLLPTKTPMQFIEKDTSIQIPEIKLEPDWCRKQIFRSIWSSNWSEETTPDSESAYDITDATDDIVKWYERRAREIEQRSGLASYALHLATLATVGGGVTGLDTLMFNLLTLDTLVYDINVEGVTLKDVENMSLLETCTALMKMSTKETFVSDLKGYVVPFLKRYEVYTKQKELCFVGLVDYLESISVNDLAPILLLLQSDEYKLDVRSHLDLVERCLFAYSGTDQLDMACDLLDTILKESDGTIPCSSLVRRVSALERLVAGSSKLSWRGVRVPPRALRDVTASAHDSKQLLTKLARDLATDGNKPTQSDWEKLLKDILELQATLFECISKEQCYEIYASALLTSGDAASIRLAASVMSCGAGGGGGAGAGGGARHVPPARAAHLALNAAREYFNSASSLVDPALKLAECCLTLIKDDNKEIQEELDLIAALQILHSFNLNILPIQVRLCEDKMSLVESCLKSTPSAFLNSHKLLKLAALLKVAGDDETARESRVLQLVCAHAVEAGDGGCGAGVAAARRLAALRAASAAPLLAHVARHAHAHADTHTRRDLYAAALAHCQPHDMEDMLRARLSLELEGFQQMGVTLKESTHHHLSERWPSTDDEFADAITTPVIEQKDLVAPAHSEKKIPLFNYLLDSFQNKFSLSDSKSSATDVSERTVHLQQFYGTLYPWHEACDGYYRYDRFSVPDALDGRAPVGHAVLKWFYIQNCLEGDCNAEMECEVVQKCAEELLYKDTALSVACLLRAAYDTELTQRFVQSNHTDTAVSAALYATLVRCNATTLHDNVYRNKPRTMAETTLKERTASKERLETVVACISRLSGLAEASSLRARGFAVNALLFDADRDYRREVVWRVARSPEKEHLDMALSLAGKYSLDAVDVWLQHAAGALHKPHLTVDSLPKERGANAHERILESLYPQIAGNDHAALITLFTILKAVDDKPQVAGLSAAEHIKLLKKAKAASPELDYKLVVSGAPADAFAAHVLHIMKPETAGMVAKFLRTLPPAVKIPVPVNELYTKWLTKYFFSVPPNQASSKKWMQQYRQCASYFNKLSKEELMRFINDTCFTDAALEQVPHGTRNVMIMQAVDYCQQEQENDFKFNKNEQTWAQVGQELSRWARWLETFHSAAVQNIIDNTQVPRDQGIWAEVEKSHGCVARLLPALSALVMRHGVRGAALGSLLQCLRAPADAAALFRHLAERHRDTPEDMELLITRLTQYHKDGVKFPEDFIERVLQRASELGLPPHKQIGLLALSSRAQLDASDDMDKVAKFSLDLFRTEWPNEPYLKELTEESLMSESGRRAAFRALLDACTSLHQRRALVDVLACWPPVREGETRSLHCEFLQSLLYDPELEREALVYIKMLLRRPLLSEEEVKFLAESAPAGSVVNAAWIALLNKGDTAKEVIVGLLQKHEETVKELEIDHGFIKELLDNQMLIPLVPTALYHNIVDYIVGQTPVDERPENVYDVRWATAELVKANYLAEAGNLYLLAAGAPSQLRGFSETVRFCKNMALFEHQL